MPPVYASDPMTVRKERRIPQIGGDLLAGSKDDLLRNHGRYFKQSVRKGLTFNPLLDSLL